MKKHISSILLVLVFFVGLSVMLYPTISDYINSKHQSRAIAEYNEMLANMTEDDYSHLFEEAYAYNARLYSTDKSFYAPEKVEGYWETFDVSGTGIMGYVSIEKIGVELPLYHGTSEEVLNVAVGHLQGTSLPVGGENTHCVLSAHRGLPSAKLFTNLDQVELGDVFTLTVLNEVLTYQVDQILVVIPSDVAALQTVAGEDYCTLVTCTPYGINSHRMLVRGTRIATEEEKRQIYISADAFKIDPFIVTPIVAVPMLFVLLVILLSKYRTKSASTAEESTEGKKKTPEDEASDEASSKGKKKKKKQKPEKKRKEKRNAVEQSSGSPVINSEAETEIDVSTQNPTDDNNTTDFPEQGGSE